MGANAQTTVPSFTIGQVLEAAQLNQSARTGVPVFAGTTERDAAFGGSGEKTLAEGQLCYLESTNVVQYYDGSNWATVGPQTLTSGLNLITATTFSAAATVSFATSTFTSTYRNYKILFDVTSNSTDLQITIRLRASGTDDTAANYNYGFYGIPNTGAAFTFQGLNQTSIFGAYVNDATGGGGQLGGQFAIDLIDPQLSAKTTGFMSTYTTDAGFNTAAIIVGGFSKNATTQFDAMSFIASTGNMTGAYAVYGYDD
jgi:hypothetical protein